MAAGDAQTKFSIPFETNAPEVGSAAAKALEELRQKIQGSQAAIRDMTGSMRALRGSSDDVKQAKEQLAARIQTERNAISAANLELLKAGTSYEKVAARAKEMSKSEDAVTASLQTQMRTAIADTTALAKAHGEQNRAQGEHVNATQRSVAALKGFDIVGRAGFRRLGELKEAFGGMGVGATAAVIGVVALTAAVVALVTATVDAGIALAKFIITSANAQRTMLLTQEGLLGSSESAKHFAAQVDDITSRVPLAADEVAKLGDELAGKHLQGQPLVDAMNAIAQTTAAKGQAAGDKLKEKLILSLGGGAKDARIAAEKQFGQLNARKMLDLDVQLRRFKETAASLTRDVNLEPFLKGFNEILSVFDQSTVSGQAIKEIVTALGNGLSTAVADSAPFVKSFLKQLIIYTLEGAITFLQLKRQIKEAFGPDTLGGADALKVSLWAAKIAVTTIVGELLLMYGAWRLIERQIAAVKAVFDGLVALVTNSKKVISEGWGDTGKAVVSGLVGGITGGAGSLVSSVTGLADKVKSGFKSALGIHSPSAVFAEYGAQTAAGFEQGVSGSAGTSAASAATGLAQAPSGTSGGRGSINVNVEINVGAGGNADVAKQIAQPSILGQLTKAIEDALAAHGLVPEAV